jgi:MFS family permease
MAIPPFTVTLLPQVWYIILLMMVEGAAFGLIGILGIVMVARATTSSDRGSAMGALGVCRYGGFTLGPLIISLPLAFLGEFTYSYGVGFAVLGVIAALSGVSLYFLLNPEHEMTASISN